MKHMNLPKRKASNAITSLSQILPNYAQTQWVPMAKFFIKPNGEFPQTQCLDLKSKVNYAFIPHPKIAYAIGREGLG